MNMDKKKVTFKNPQEINEKKNLYTQNKNKKISNKKIDNKKLSIKKPDDIVQSLTIYFD